MNKKNWHGWTKDNELSNVEYFDKEKIACKCVIPCEQCGFYYLDEKGNELKRTNVPLCGVW